MKKLIILVYLSMFVFSSCKKLDVEAEKTDVEEGVGSGSSSFDGMLH